MSKQGVLKIVCTTLATVAFGLTTASGHAQCRPQTVIAKPTSWAPAVSGARLIQTGYQGEQAPKEKATIVGMWHVIFTAKTMNGNPIPDTVIDNAIVVWHEDKTEIMNSGRPPQDGNFCLGVWEELGPRTYGLNHFAWSANGYTPGSQSGTVGEPIGPVHYREVAIVGPLGRHYSGSFSLDQYDTSGKVATAFTGVMKATRITLDTTVKDLQ